MKFTYLLINLLTVIFPVALSFDRRVAFFKSWKLIWPGLLITGLLFLGWDILFTVKGVWSFNPRYVIGLSLFGLPVEEMLFFVTVPFSCLFIYACLSYYVRWRMKSTMIVSVNIAGVCMASLFLYHDKLYTLVTFSLLLTVTVLLQFVFKVKWLDRFYLAYLVMLIPFYIVNGILTSWPVVLYNNTENMGIRIGTIPLEDHFYLMTLLLMNTGFFEYFKSKSNPAMTELPVYTKSQLALRNGQDKPEIWVAYQGTIYDVTLSRLWRDGKHYEHWAGQDLTEELADAPHTYEVFQRFDAIGRLAPPCPPQRGGLGEMM